MALIRGSAPAAPTHRPDGSVEEVPDEIPRGRGGRPKIRAIIDGVESADRFVTMTRASTLGKTLEDSFGIQKWTIRQTVFGLSRRPDLVARAAAIRTNTESADKTELGDVADAAQEAARSSEGATRGTALHLLSEQRDQGLDLSHLPDNLAKALDVYAALMATVRVVATETFVVCDRFDAAGTFDRVVELLVDTEVRVPDPDADNGALHTAAVLPAGTRVVVDLKTNKDAKYFGPTYAVQQAVYGNGIPYGHTSGRAGWPGGVAPSNEWALILHIPIDSLADAGFYWVDLRAGLELAELAMLVRDQRDRADLFHPAELGARPAAPVMTRAALLGELRTAPDEAALDALWRAHSDLFDAECGMAAKGRAAELAAPPAPATAAAPQGEVIGALRAAATPDELGAIYDRHTAAGGTWTPYMTSVVKARLAELEQAVAVSA